MAEVLRFVLPTCAVGTGHVTVACDQGEQRCRSDPLLGYHRYPIDTSIPGIPAGSRCRQTRQEKLLVDNVDRMLQAAGITCRHIVVLNRTGEGAPFSAMTGADGNVAAVPDDARGYKRGAGCEGAVRHHRGGDAQAIGCPHIPIEFDARKL